MSGIREALARLGVEQMGLVGAGAEPHPLALLRRAAYVGAGHEARLLTIDVGTAEDVRVGSDVLDYLDPGRNAVALPGDVDVFRPKSLRPSRSAAGGSSRASR